MKPGMLAAAFAVNMLAAFAASIARTSSGKIKTLNDFTSTSPSTISRIPSASITRCSPPSRLS